MKDSPVSHECDGSAVETINCSQIDTFCVVGREGAVRPSPCNPIETLKLIGFTKCGGVVDIDDDDDDSDDVGWALKALPSEWICDCGVVVDMITGEYDVCGG